MKVYEFMNLLGKAPADKDVKVCVCLTLQELMNGDQIDEGCFCLSLDIDDFDARGGVVGTTV